MKVGTFGVKNFKEIIAKKEDIKIIWWKYQEFKLGKMA
jgi:hypothetical protein